MINRNYFIAILLLNWVLFLCAFFGFAMYMDNRNLQNEIKYTKAFEDSMENITLCNGTPVGWIK